MPKPLHGIRVLEFAGLAPGPFAGVILADWGAEVIRIDREGQIRDDMMGRGKKSVILNLKAQPDIERLKQLVKTSDALIEPFRPGVMERLGLGPEVLLKVNPGLVYARMTGFGQGGDADFESAAGHDLNYLAQSGILASLRPEGGKPIPPINILGDFAGGGMVCAFGILMALYERKTSGKGQVVDAAMVDGAAYVSTMVFKLLNVKQMSEQKPSTNMLDGGAPFYTTYECKDGKFFSVGAIESQFFKNLCTHLEVDAPRQNNKKTWPKMKALFEARFKEKTRDEWTAIFHKTDSCAFPVLTYEEAVNSPHNAARGTWMEKNEGSRVLPAPAPVPKLSRTPAYTIERPSPVHGADNALLSKL